MKQYLNRGLSALLAYFWISALIDPFIASTNLFTAPLLAPYFMIVLVLMVLIKKIWILIPLLVITTLNFFSMMFNNGLFFTKEWFVRFVKMELITGGAGLMSNELAVIVFTLFALLMLMVIVRSEKWRLPCGLMLVYLLVLIGVNQAAFIDNLLQFLLMSSLLAYWLGIREKQLSMKLVPTVIVVVMIALVATTARSFPDKFASVHYRLQVATIDFRNDLTQKGFYEIQKFGSTTGIRGRAGFSEATEFLGGPIADDNTLVFEVVQSKERNWRIETKEQYTGTGWTTAIRELDDFELPLSTRGDNITYEAEPETVYFLKSRAGLTYLPLPLGKVDISSNDKSMLFGMKYSPVTQRVRMASAVENELVNLNYTIYDADYTEQDLLASKVVSDPRNTLNYLQLPKDLPERIQELAEAIVGDESNDYRKVKKIEAFLSTANGTVEIDDKPFKYSTLEAVYTPEGRDFVDHFLFDTRIGYCEHYAASMVVMLRSLGIQSRWVKGYASGNVSRSNLNGRKTYAITNDDAHVWPEVYFEGIGWVAFEPTPGFSAPEMSVEGEVDVSNQVNRPKPEKPNDTDTPAQKPIEEQVPNVEGKEEGVRASISWKPLLSGFLLVVGLFVLLRHWLGLRLWIVMLKSQKELSFAKTFNTFLKYANRVCVRDESQSIRDYLSLVSMKLKSEITVGAHYEALVYGSEEDNLLNECERAEFLELALLLKQYRKTRKER